MLDQCKDARHVLGGMARMANLDAIHSLGGERGDPLSRSALTRVRENGEAAGIVDEADRIAHGEPVLRHERRAPVAEVAVEGVAEVDGPAFGDHRTRHVRASNRAAGRLLEHRVELDAHAKLVQALHDARGARAPHLAKRDELRFHLSRVGEVETEDVRLDVTLDRAELDARNDTNANLETGGDRFSDAVERVVIGERNRLKSDALCLTNDVCRGARSIRRRGVRVEVDEGSGAVAYDRR